MAAAVDERVAPWSPWLPDTPPESSLTRRQRGVYYYVNGLLRYRQRGVLH